MDKQQKIVQMLWYASYNSKEMRCNFVKSDDFEELAIEIVCLDVDSKPSGIIDKLKFFNRYLKKQIKKEKEKNKKLELQIFYNSLSSIEDIKI